MNHSKVKLGGRDTGIYSYSILPDKSELNIDGHMHHIHILDRSGSMYWCISDLMDDVKKTLRMIDKDDYVTILWFSGAGQYRTMVKCAKNDPESIDKILDSLKSTVGMTCFSDPIKELDSIIRETAPMCDVFNVTIFTDGEPVTPWSFEEEVTRIFTNLDVIKDKIIAFNTIGYGNYYNRDLLLRMSKTTPYGQMTHASKIDQYSEIFSHNRESLVELVGKTCTVTCDGADILVRTARTIRRAHDKLSFRLCSSLNDILIVDSSNQSGDITIKVGSDINVCPRPVPSRIDNLTLDTEFPFYNVLGYAYKLYEDGDRTNALEVLNLLGAEELANRMLNAFTIEEVGNFTSYMKKLALSSKDSSMKDIFLTIPSNTYMPDKDAYCILDLLQDLIDSNAKYIPTSTYNRIGRRVVDEFNCFEKYSEQSAFDMHGIVLNQSRMNISLRFEVEGRVKLNPKRAKSVGLPSEIEDCRTYRTHTIVQDGGLNMSSLTVLLPSDYKDDITGLRGKLINIGAMTEAVLYSDSTTRLSIDLTKLPVINYRYLDDATACNIMYSEMKLLELEASNKVINAILKDDISDYTLGTSTSDRPTYTPEQVEVLKEHGLDAYGRYNAIAPKVQEVEDYNIVREFKTYIKGFSSLPSITSILTKIKNGKNLTPSEDLVYKYILDYGYGFIDDSTDIANLKSIRSKNKAIINQQRFFISGSKMALVLTGNTLPGANYDPKDDTYKYSDDKNVLVAKLVRTQIPV